VRKPRSQSFAPRIVAIGVVACLMSAACATATATGTGATPSSPSSPNPGPTSSSSLTATVPPSPTPGPSASKGAGCLVGEAWNNYAEERIAQWDQPAIEKELAAAGDDYLATDAASSQETQRTQIDKLVAKGAKVIVLRAQGGSVGLMDPANLKAVERAVAAGVAVIAYDDLIESPSVLWISIDQVEAGRAEARAILAARPKGNYVIIRGMKGQPLEALRASGIDEVLQPVIARGDIEIVAEPYTVNWDPSTAQTEMAQILARNKSIDAVIAESDGMATGAIAALKEVDLAGKVAVGGQDADWISLARVAAGIQTVSVWPDLRTMGTVAGDAAVALCKDPDISKLKGTKLYSSPGHNQVPSILLAPKAITKDNLNLVLEAGWLPKDYLCASIDPSGAPSACR